MGLFRTEAAMRAEEDADDVATRPLPDIPQTRECLGWTLRQLDQARHAVAAAKTLVDVERTATAKLAWTQATMDVETWERIAVIVGDHLIKLEQAA
jgi:hypothetical protein